MKVIVIGGGVAGTSSATALRRVGADVTIYEAHPDPGGVVGSFVSLATNALRGLDALGRLAPVQAAGFPVTRQRMWAGSGALLGDLPRGRLAADDLQSVTLMRADLVGVLRASAAAAGATLVTGEHLVAATPSARGVALSFASGLTEGADLVIGADGIWSACRSAVAPTLGQPLTPRYAGAYVVSGRSALADVEPGVFNLVFGRHGAFIYLRPVDGEVWWQAQVTDAAEPVRDGVTDAEWLARLTQVFRTERMPTAILAAATRLDRPSINHILDPVPAWHRQTLALVGDAAHPAGAGQGAAMAIEDGIVLAHHLAHASSIPEGLAAYEAARRPRIERVLKIAQDSRESKQAGRRQRTIERFAMPIVFRFFYEQATSWLYTDELPSLAVAANSSLSRQTPLTSS